MKKPDFGKDVCLQQDVSAVEGKVSEKQRNTQTRGDKKYYWAFLDSEYCRNTFDIFPDLLDRSQADSGTSFQMPLPGLSSAADLMAGSCCWPGRAVPFPCWKSSLGSLFNEGAANAAAGVKACAFNREGQELPHSLTHPHVLERCSQSPSINPALVRDVGAVKLIISIKTSLR